MRNKTPERLAKARELYALGKGWSEIGREVGVGPGAIRQWLDPIYYAYHKRKAGEWQKSNAEKVNKNQRIRNKNLTREQKDKRAEYTRRQYATNPAYKESMKRLKKKYLGTAQGLIAYKISIATLSFGNRFASTYRDFMKAVTGMSCEEFTARFDTDGHFDHIVPKCAFDLANPEHLVRCCYPDNVRIIPKRENQIKGRSVPENLDIMSLPWVGTADALAAATVFISKQLKALERSEGL